MFEEPMSNIRLTQPMKTLDSWIPVQCTYLLCLLLRHSLEYPSVLPSCPMHAKTIVEAIQYSLQAQDDDTISFSSPLDTGIWCNILHNRTRGRILHPVAFGRRIGLAVEQELEASRSWVNQHQNDLYCSRSSSASSSAAEMRKQYGNNEVIRECSGSCKL